MKRLLLAALLTTTAGVAGAAVDVGVSINIGDPNFFGRIDIGNLPRPPLIYAEPLVIRPARVVREPLYLRVPPGHAKRWSRYCNRYNACGYPVYFVQDRWYRDEYAPRYRERHDYDRRDFERRDHERRDYERRVIDRGWDDRRGDDRRGNDRGWDDRRGNGHGGGGHDNGRGHKKDRD